MEPPPTLLGAHLNKLTGNLDSNNSSIQDILQIIEEMPNSQPNSVSGSSLATSDAADCAKSCDNPDPLQFKEGALIAFRGCDGYEFNVKI